MQRVLPLSNALLTEEDSTVILQDQLDRLAMGKMGWNELLAKTNDLFVFARLRSSLFGRTLLHLAVLDGQIDVVRALSSNPFLKQNRDDYGLGPIELAQFLGNEEMIKILEQHLRTNAIELAFVEGFQQVNSPIFESKESFESVLSCTAKAKRDDTIPAEKIWMGIYFDKEIQRGLHAPVSIQYIDEEIGFGVFAEKKIAPCAFVGEYTGQVLERNRKNLKGKKYCLRYSLWEGKKQFTIDAEQQGNFTRFINHSANPNLGLQSVYWKGIPRMIFVALKEIPEGAQLTFDYGPFFWKEFDQTPHDL